MTLVIRIKPYQPHAEPDTLGRHWTGYYPSMSEEAAFEAGRGSWTLGPEADRHTFVMIVGRDRSDAGPVLAVAEIDTIEDDPLAPGKRFLTGRVLAEGHPVRDTYVGQPDPSGSRSRNPIAYAHDLPEERAYQLRSCRCGCGREVRRAFAPGHDQRAIRNVVDRYFGGSTVRFLDWMDENGPGRDGDDERNGPPVEGE